MVRPSKETHTHTPQDSRVADACFTRKFTNCQLPPMCSILLAEKTLLGHVTYLREKFEKGVIQKIQWCDTRDMTADGHTKVSSRPDGRETDHHSSSEGIRACTANKGFVSRLREQVNCFTAT